MSVWTSIVSGIKGLFGVGAGVATANPLSVAKSGLDTTHAVVDGLREAKRDSIEGGIKKEYDSNNVTIEQAIKKATSNGAALALAFVLAGFCMVGCASAPSRDYCPPTGNVGRLLDAQGFKEAAVASPKWTQDALKTVNALEADNQRLRAKANQVP